MKPAKDTVAAIRRTSKRRRSNKQKKRGGLRRGGGGAWRAFVSASLRGEAGRDGGANLKLIPQEYGALRGPERARYKAEGGAGTGRHRAGMRALAKRRRDVQREVERDLKRLRGAAIHEGSLVSIPQGSDDIRLAELPDMINSLQDDVRCSRATEADRLDLGANNVKAWRLTRGVAIRDRFASEVPGLARSAPSFSGEAETSTSSLISWRFPAETLVPRAVAALTKTDPLVPCTLR